MKIQPISISMRRGAGDYNKLKTQTGEAMKITMNTRQTHETQSRSTLATQPGVRLPASRSALRSRRASEFSFCLLLLLTLSARAQDTFWTSAGSGNWTNSASWSLGAPSNNPNVWITNAGNKTVTIDAAAPAGNLTITNLRVAATSSTNTLYLSGNASPLNVLGTLYLGSTGGVSGGMGAVVVDGGRLVTTNAKSTIGFFGVKGAVTVSNGTWLSRGVNVGQGSAGTLTFVGGTNSFSALSFDTLSVGFFSGSAATGNVLLIGGQLLTTNNCIFVLGDTGNGTMTVSGGQWLSSQVRLGQGSGGSGILNVNGGSNVTLTSFFVGRDVGATGMVNVTAGTLTITNAGGTAQLVVGRTGLGTFTLSDGTVTADQLLVTNGAKSAFTFNGGILNVKATTVTNGSVFTVGNGSSIAALNLLGGTHTFRNGLGINSNATLGGTGLISMAGLTLTNAGTIAPGFSPGTLSVTGDVFLAGSSVVTMELAATNSFDRLLVSGQIGFGGTLVITNFGGFTPLNGQSFDLFDFASAVGTFAQIDSPWQWDTSLLYTQGIITAVPEPSSLILALIGAAAMVLARRRGEE